MHNPGDGETNHRTRTHMRQTQEPELEAVAETNTETGVETVSIAALVGEARREVSWMAAVAVVSGAAAVECRYKLTAATLAAERKDQPLEVAWLDTWEQHSCEVAVWRFF